MLYNAKFGQRIQKQFSGKARLTLKICEDFILHVGASYKLVVKSAKSLNQIFCVIECWQKPQKCKICSTTIKRLFWENEAIAETSRKPFPYIAVFYKFLLKSL